MLYGGRDETPIEPSYFDIPMGAFFVGYLDDAPVATGAWRRRTDVEFEGTSQTAEIKRMYVVARARRVGLARAMLAHLEETALAAGAEAMVLETGTRQPEAITLYVTAGYTPVPGFGFYKDEPLSRCFARSLVVPVAQGMLEFLRRGRPPEEPVVVDFAVGLARVASHSCCAAACSAGPRSRRRSTAGSRTAGHPPGWRCSPTPRTCRRSSGPLADPSLSGVTTARRSGIAARHAVDQHLRLGVGGVRNLERRHVRLVLPLVDHDGRRSRRRRRSPRGRDR